MNRDDPETTDALLRAPLEIVGRLATASNLTLLCRVGAPGDGRLAVYKPRAGEAPLWDFPMGTLHRREVAAHLVDRALGLGMVPTTVLRTDAPHGVGSVQLFIHHDPERHYFALLEEDDAEIDEQLVAMVAFDIVVNNADRKGGHVLVDDDEGVWLVDHGVCFNEQPKLRTVAWDFAGQPVPGDVRRRAAALSSRLADASSDLASSLHGLLSVEEVAATAARAAALSTMENFPGPSGPRPYPWPPI